MEELSPVKKALLEVRNLRAKLEALEGRQYEPIAVTGAGLRLPGGVDSLPAFWDLLRDGLDVVGEVPPDRWDNERLYEPDVRAPGKLSTRYGSFLRDVDKFDAAFFGISPREAESMDPQHRLLLEVAWEALERAGQSPAQLAGSQAGVYLGISNSDYGRILLGDLDQIDPYVSTGSLFSVAAGRLSYTLGLHGPSLVVDTACSSSLVAVHLAVQSLRGRECDLALAAGVNLMLSPAITVNFSKAQMMAPDGRCKTFDAAADGYVRGEGCVVVVLKRLADALAGGDPILGVIRGTAVNHDGRSGGLTAPNGPAQTAVIRAALDNAGVQPEQIGYVETHGTGTALGDPIEVHALAEALAVGRAPTNPLRIGSVKTNLGHLEAAAGLAGLLKALLVVQNGQIPPHLHLRALNPHIRLDGRPVAIPTELTPWSPLPDGRGSARAESVSDRSSLPLGRGFDRAESVSDRSARRLAGVSSFGLSGVNAHIIVEEAPPLRKPAVSSLPDGRGFDGAESVSDRSHYVLPLSAQNDAVLATLAGRYAAHLASPAGQAEDFADVCFTAGAGRSHFGERLAVVTGDRAAAKSGLAAFAAGERPVGVYTGHAPAGVQPDITFLYTGHGGNYQNMGRQLYDAEPVFRAALDECDALTRAALPQPLLTVLYSGASSPLLEQMTYAQVSLFALQYALTQLWRSWGVRPTLVMGHSAGEYAAAAAAGVFSLADSLKLVLSRGQLMESPALAGGMATVFAAAERVESLLAPYGGRVAIAAYNGPNTVTISGAAGDLEAALHALRGAGVKTRRLPIDGAAHSPLLDPFLDAFEREVGALVAHAPQVGLVSTVSGQLAGGEELGSAAYWRRHLRQPVRFEEAMHTLYNLGQRVFVEIGPRPLLLALGGRCVPAESCLWLPSLREAGQDRRQMAESLAQLYTHGAEIDWQGVYGGARRRAVLPTYPFARRRYWTGVAPLDGAPAVSVEATTEATAQALAVAGDLQAAQAPLDLLLPAYAAKWEALRCLSSGYIVAALQDLGAFDEPAAVPPDELAARLGVLPVYTGLLRRWLRRLAAEGLLVQEGECWRAAQPLPAPDLAVLRAAAWEQLADAPVLFDYVEQCGPRLAAVLTGTTPALETLFPGGSDALAERLYRGWAGSRYYANLLRALLQAYAATRGGQPLRILEVGAGTGATTSALLPVLSAATTTYDFTDLSDLFLHRAAERFAAWPFLRFGRLDLEASPAAQGYAAGGYDVIVATNVLHATADLHRTLDHVHDLLAPGGLLLINEVTEHLAWYDITTGLIEGWQRFDDDLRRDQPLLDAPAWAAALAAHGFGAVQAWPEAGSAPAILGQHVFAALKAPSNRAEVASLTVSDRSTLPHGRGSGRAESVSDRATPPHGRGSDRAESVSDRASLPGGRSFDEDGDLRRRLREAVADERAELLFAFVGGQIRRVLRLDAGAVLERGQRLLDLGLDSLMALELRRLLATGIGAAEDDLSATLVFDYPTVGALADYLAVHLAAEDVPAATAAPGPQPDPAVAPAALRAADVAAMTDEEVEALLLQKLSRQG